MQSCDRALELISLGLDGALNETERRELEAHMASCADCRSLARDLESLSTYLPELEEEVPEGFRASVMERVRQEKVLPMEAPVGAGKKKVAWRRWGSLAAVFAVILLGARMLPYVSGGRSGAAAPEAAMGAVEQAPNAESPVQGSYDAAGGVAPEVRTDPTGEGYPGKIEGALKPDAGLARDEMILEEDRQTLRETCLAWLRDSGADLGAIDTSQMLILQGDQEIWEITLGDPAEAHVILLWDPVAGCVLEQAPME